MENLAEETSKFEQRMREYEEARKRIAGLKVDEKEAEKIKSKVFNRSVPNGNTTENPFDADDLYLKFMQNMQKQQETNHKLEISKIHEQFKADLTLKLVEIHKDIASNHNFSDYVEKHVKDIYTRIFGDFDE